MNRRALLSLLAASSLLGTRLALARQPAGVRQIANFLSGESCAPAMKEYAPVLLKALAGLGHVEGRNLAFEWHCYGRDFSRGAQIAAELVRRGVDILSTMGTPSTRILQNATKTIPILTAVNDPVASGFTRSLVRPDGNITGFCHRHPDTPAKQVELIRRIVPKLARLVIIGDVRYPGARELLRPYEMAARAGGLVPEVKLVDRSGFDRVFSEMKGSGARAAFIEFALNEDEAKVAELARRHGVATMLYSRGYAEFGGLMSFTMYHENTLQREVAILDKVLRGIKPADIPWELPDRSHLAINLRTAKMLDLTVPSELLLRADQVIE